MKAHVEAAIEEYAGVNHHVADPSNCSHRDEDKKEAVPGGTSGIASRNKFIKLLQESNEKNLEATHTSGRNAKMRRRFPMDMRTLVQGEALVDRDDFIKHFDLGFPLDRTDSRNTKVLIQYNSDYAIPQSFRHEAMSQTELPVVSANNATSECDYLHIILQDHSGSRRQCTATFGQYESFHIHKMMRVPKEKGPINRNWPLRLVERGFQATGSVAMHAPNVTTTTLLFWKTLQKYLASLDDTLEKLKPVVEKIAFQNSVVVLVCNLGQSALLLNFLCSAQRRGFDTSAILVFATDQETYDLVTAMGGVVVFHDESIFGEMPKKAAGKYGDKTFRNMMLAKVYCVHLVALLGYDVLFQDVDVIWYKNPLEYFHSPNAIDAQYDVYFQDDGNHGLFYAPYSANTGFYFVRNNDRTKHFFNSLLLAGDMVWQTRSHQIPLVALLQEHASAYALKIKIFSREENDFPGGYTYHRRYDQMKDIIKGKVNPQIFHMSWTSNSTIKVKFYQQMGEWYLEDRCFVKKPEVVLRETNASGETMASRCCATVPNIVCHFRDKPSKHSCSDSPPIDAGARSFW